MMMVMCNKQQLWKIYGKFMEIYGKVKQHWGWVEKKALLIKKTV